MGHPGEVVTREELREKIWPADTFVDFDQGLNNAVKRLRDALGDSAETPRFIEPGGSMSANDLVKSFLGRPQQMTAFQHWLNEEFEPLPHN